MSRTLPLKSLVIRWSEMTTSLPYTEKLINPTGMQLVILKWVEMKSGFTH